MTPHVVGPRAVLATLLAVLTALAGLTVAPAPVRAAEARLCTGYAGCASAGYSDDGYAAQAQTYWWRMTLGHNCTAYAAYRMVRSGLPNARPWTGGGDARRWGHEMAGITDGVPRVGAVAWWDRGAGGHGRLGHVAYVEEVVSPDVVVVSEDVYGGDFHWKRITRTGGGWPSGFIHFNDETLRVEERPRVVGRARVDRPLTVTPGRWDREVDLSYQWLDRGRALPGATRTTYTPTARQVRSRLSVQVTARRSGFEPVVVTTAATEPVARGLLRVIRKPRVRGEAQVDRAVRLRLPRTSPRADHVRVRWLLDGRPVRGARSPRLRPAPSAAGRRLTVEVRIRRRGYETRTLTRAVGRVREGEIVVRRAFRVVGTVQAGQQLRVLRGRYSPSEARLGYVWFRDDQPLLDARGATYVVRPEDVGHRVAVVVGLVRRGYVPELTGAVAGTATAAVVEPPPAGTTSP